MGDVELGSIVQDSKQMTDSMQYQEIAPTEALAKYIKCFWAMESVASDSAGPERILPDGCSEVVFNLADPFNEYKADGTTRSQPLALLVGQMRRELLIEPSGTVRLLAVRFWPGGAYPFLVLPQDEIAEKVVALDDVWGGIAREIRSRLGEARTTIERVRHVESVLLRRLSLFRAHDDAMLKVVALILRAAGSVSIAGLARDMGISARQLDRRFNTRVGLTPKMLCRIVRFQRALKMLERGNGSPGWVRIAVECGYYDQSHFIKEFNELAGTQPSKYFTEQNAMSDYFTQG